MLLRGHSHFSSCLHAVSLVVTNEAPRLQPGKHAVEHSLSLGGGGQTVPIIACQCQMGGKGGGEAKTRAEHRKHISEMSAQGFSAYTRTASEPLSTNRVKGERGIHSGSDRKRQKFYLLWCLKHGSPDDAPTAAFNPWSWGCNNTRSGSATQGSGMLQHPALTCQPKCPRCEAAPCAAAHSCSGSGQCRARMHWGSRRASGWRLSRWGLG